MRKIRKRSNERNRKEMEARIVESRISCSKASPDCSAVM